MWTLAPAPGRCTVAKFPWAVIVSGRLVAGTARSTHQLAWMLTSTAGPEPVGDRVQVASAAWTTRRLTSLPSLYQRRASIVPAAVS